MTVTSNNAVPQPTATATYSGNCKGNAYGISRKGVKTICQMGQHGKWSKFNKWNNDCGHITEQVLLQQGQHLTTNSTAAAEMAGNTVTLTMTVSNGSM